MFFISNTLFKILKNIKISTIFTISSYNMDKLIQPFNLFGRQIQTYNNENDEILSM